MLNRFEAPFSLGFNIARALPVGDRFKIGIIRIFDMKQLILELPFQGFWRLIFGRYAGKVQVVEALRCFKCDQDGFAIICKIRILDERVRVNDLTRGGHIRKIETLYTENDGSVVIFMSGDYPEVSRARKRPPTTNVFFGEPPEFMDAGRMKVSVVGEEKELQKVMRRAELLKAAPKILSLARLKPRLESSFPTLSPKQKQSLLAAYSLGYYEVPRRVSSRELAGLLRIDKSTLAEHLRKAERKIIKGVLEA